VHPFSYKRIGRGAKAEGNVTMLSDSLYDENKLEQAPR